LIDRLEKAALVERKNNPEDRRAILVCLTEGGRKTAHQILGIVEQENQAFLSGLTTEEAMILKALLKKIG
jgi:DNA-binding MarR family transcriptional regulator